MKRFIPMFDRVLIERAEAMTRTRGGIVIPEKAQQKILKGTVVAVGPGSRNKVAYHINCCDLPSSNYIQDLGNLLYKKLCNKIFWFLAR